MKLTQRLGVLAVSVATLFGTLAISAPADAATYYYYYPTTQYTYRYYTSPTRTTTYQPTTQTVTKPAQTTAAPAPTTQTAAPSTTATTAGLTAAEQQMLNLVNAERAKAGLSPLKADLQLTKLARLKSQDMINKNYFSHQSPTYGSPFDMMKSYGVTYKTAGENLAGNSSVQAAHTALMNSSGHRANILNGSFTHVGIGIMSGGNYGMMFTQMFVGR